MCSSAVSSSTRRKWCETRLGHRRQQFTEGLDHLRRREVVVPGRVTDRLAHVLVEELDRAVGEPAHRGIGIAREPQQFRQREPELEQAERGPHELDIAGRVACLPLEDATEPDPLPLHGLDQGGWDAAPGGERIEVEQLGLVPRLSPRRGHGGGQIGVRGAQLAGHDTPDRRQREALGLQRPDLADRSPRAHRRTRPRGPRARAGAAGHVTGST